MRMIKWKYFREFSWKCLKLPDMIKAALPIKSRTMFSRVIHIPGVKLIASFLIAIGEDARILKERIMELTKDCSLYSGHGNIYE